MKKTAFVSHEDCSLHDTGWNHPDHQGRLPAVVRAVQRDMVALWEPLLQIEAVPAEEVDLLRVHTSGHLERLRARSDEAASAGRTLELDGVPVSGASWSAAVAAAGCALTAVDLVHRGDVRNAFALSRPPGRGAAADSAGEHSLLNHVAVAARHLQDRDAGPVLVVAWGARPPVALARLLAEGEPVRLLSIHTHPLSFPDPDPTADAQPVPGAALAPGSGGADFAAALAGALDGLDPADPPGFVLLSAGFDILDGDPTGKLAVQPDEIHEITRVLRAWVDERAGGRLVSVLEGGYSAPDTARAIVQHLHALADLPPA